MNSPLPVGGKKYQLKPHFLQRYLEFSTQAPGNDTEISLFHFIDIVSVTVRNLQPGPPNKQHWPSVACSSW